MEPPPGFVPSFGPGETKIESPPWLPAGWHAVERPRETGTHADRFYYTPDAAVRLRSKPEVERYLAGKPTLESLAKGVPRPPPAPPSCPVEEVTALARDLLAQNRAKAAARAGGARGAAGGSADGAAGVCDAARPSAAAAPSVAAAPPRGPPPLPPAPSGRGSKRRMESELETLGRQLCVRGVILSAARLRRSTHLPLLKALPTLPLATPLADALDPWPIAAAAEDGAAGRDER